MDVGIGFYEGYRKPCAGFGSYPANQVQAAVNGELKQWHKVTVNVTGLNSSETSASLGGLSASLLMALFAFNNYVAFAARGRMTKR